MWMYEVGKAGALLHYFPLTTIRTLCGLDRGVFTKLAEGNLNIAAAHQRCLGCFQQKEADDKAGHEAVVVKSNLPPYPKLPTFPPQSEPGVFTSTGTTGAPPSGAPKGDRFNTGKWIPTFWPREALEAAARVWEYGAKKYARDNWKSGMSHRELADCALRHVTAWADGADHDKESGLHHIWHALCNLAMLCWMIVHRPDLDDRWKGQHQVSATNEKDWK